ncbi:MAG: class I adenylate-forming enzyme family protein [Polyangiales bacterium]
MEHHVGTILYDAARECPDSLALVGDVQVTYGELHSLALRFAERLGEVARPGDGVGVFLQSNQDFVVAFFGATYAGLTVLPFVRTLPDAEVLRRLREVRAELLVCERSLAPEVHSIAPDGDKNASKTSGFCMIEPPSGDALWLPTSGTSGRSKVARISHRCVSEHTRNLVRETFRFTPDDVVLATLPLCHSFGLRTTLLATFAAKARVLLVERFDAKASLDAAARFDVTFIAGVPTMFAGWAQTEGEPLPTLRWCLSAGAPLSEATRRAAEARLGAEVREGYGLTEASFTSIDAPHHQNTVGSCGLPSPGVEVRIQRREIQIRGTNVMSGYLHDDEATSEAFEDGWLRSGDLGVIDDAGCVRVLDRLKDLIIRGGHNVVPANVEGVLREVPSVLEAAVVGRPDARLGEELVAVLVMSSAADGEMSNVFRYIASRLAKPEQPREYVILSELPLGPSRKVLRRVLRGRIESGELVPVRFAPCATKVE